MDTSRFDLYHFLGPVATIKSTGGLWLRVRISCFGCRVNHYPLQRSIRLGHFSRCSIMWFPIYSTRGPKLSSLYANYT